MVPGLCWASGGWSARGGRWRPGSPGWPASGRRRRWSPPW
uniref:Uncharacterized protein n=1 Tax=Anguilla anguilla TaxID=7936 RepID=A0A0E9PSY0_ANGAN